MTAENTRLLLENTALKRVISSTEEKDHLLKLLEDFKTVNRQLINENEDLKHRYEVSEKLRLDTKDQLQRYINKSLSSTTGGSEKGGYRGNLLQASADFIEKQLIANGLSQFTPNKDVRKFLDQRSPSMDLLHVSPSPATGLNITDYNYDLSATARSGRLPLNKKQSPIAATTPFRMTGGAILDSSESINREEEDSELQFDQTDIRIVANKQPLPQAAIKQVPVFSYKLK